MASPLFVGLKTYLARLETSLIAAVNDDNIYSDADHDRALGYRVLSAAAIEEFIEQRIGEGAKEGTSRFLKNKPTRTGRCLLIWHLATTSVAAMPVKEVEQVPHKDLVDSALDAFESRIKNTHGANRRDVRKLIYPIGLESAPQIESLLDKLQALADARDPAVHVRINRAKLMVPPAAEAENVRQIVSDLEYLDDAVEIAAQAF
ncbi:MAG: hypothetical protein ABL953_08205 [Ilumatobacteraceae bacterium]